MNRETPQLAEEAADFELLIAAQIGRLFRFGYRLTGNRPDAEDLVQDACARAFERRTSLAAARHPDRWLMRVMYNRFVDLNRRSQGSPVSGFGEGQEETARSPSDVQPESLAAQADNERDFQAAFGELEASQQALLMLCAEGYEVAEMAEICGIAAPALSARLHRARLSLARHLGLDIRTGEVRTDSGRQR